jgi:hypothetical protein
MAERTPIPVTEVTPEEAAALMEEVDLVLIDFDVDDPRGEAEATA